MAYTLQFDVKLNGLSDAQKIEAIIAAVGKQSGLTAGQLGLFEASLKSMTASGAPLNKALQDLAGSSQGLGKEVAGAARAALDASSAQAQLKTAVDSSTTAHREFRVEAENTRKTIGDLGKEMQSATKGFALGALGLGAVGGIGLQVGRQLGELPGKLLDVVKATADYGREIENLSAKTGLSIQESQRLSQIAEIAGVSTGSLTTVMRTLSKALVDGTQAGKQQRQALYDIGISATDAGGHLKSTETVIEELGKKLADMPAGPKRDFFANTLLGRGGLDLLPVITNLNSLGFAVDHAGAIMDDKGVHSAKRYSEELGRLDLVWQGLKRNMAEPIIGIIEGIPDPNQPRGPQFRGADQNAARTSVYQQLAGVPDIARLDSMRKTASEQAFNANPHLRLQQAQEQFQLLNQQKIESGTTDPADIAKWEKARENVEAISKEIANQKKDSQEIAKSWEELGRRRDALRAEGSPIAQAIVAAREDAKNAPTGALKQGYADLNTENIQKLAGEELRKNADQVMSALEKSGKAESEAFLKQLAVTDKNLSTEHANIAKAIETWESARRAEDSAQVGLISDLATRQSRLVGLTSNPGDPVDSARQELAIQQQAIAAEAAIYEKHADLYDLDQKRIEVQKRANDAQLSFEDVLASKKRSDNEAFAHLFSSGILAAQSGGGVNFLKGLGTQLETKVLDNLGMAFTDTSTFKRLSDSLHFTQKGSVAGKLLQGLPFGPKDDTSIATSTLDASTKLNTTSTDANTQALASIYSAVTGGGTIPGVNATGTPGTVGGVGGLFGGGALGSGIYSLANGFGPLGSSTEFGTPGLPQLGGVNLGAGDPAKLYSGLFGAGGGSVPSASYGGLAGLLGGLGHSGDLMGALTGISAMPGGGYQTLSTTEQIGAGIGTAGIVAGGVASAVNQFSRGGARGDLGGIASVAGTAAALDPEPISKAVLGLVSFGSGIISSLLGDPRQNRANQITKELGNATYEPQVPINETMGSNGMYSDFDQYGNFRTSNFSARPEISEPFQWYHNGQYLQYPGQVISPFQNPDLVVPPGVAPVSPYNPEGVSQGGNQVVTPGGMKQGPQTTIVVQAIDSESFGQFLSKPSNQIHLANGMTQVINGGHGSNYLQRLGAQFGTR